MHLISLKNFLIGKGQPLAVISGPCVIEGESETLYAAEQLVKIFASHNINFIFKASYDKANRSSSASFRGPGLHEGLRILEKVKNEWNIPVTSDIHSPEEAKAASEVLDILQIPAFLCRQTDLILAAAETRAIVNVKKGQFMAPCDMKNVVDKIRSTGNNNIMLTERGTTFGYNNLVSDMRSVVIMKEMGVVCYDATHSVQLPGGQGTFSGGQREFIPVLAKAAVSVGANCIFMEAHPNPSEAKSDKMSVLDFKELPSLLTTLERLYRVVQE